jgi:very-short-patch-repair endonuclease
MFKQRQQLKRQARLAERAHAMRHQPTPSEAKLWEALRAGQLGVSFKRLVPIGNYIVDFLAPSVKLLVEVDGRSHRGRDVADARRDRVLMRSGYRVLRLSAEIVNGNLAAAVRSVTALLA